METILFERVHIYSVRGYILSKKKVLLPVKNSNTCNMNKKVISLLLAILLPVCVMAQTVTIKFTAHDAASQHVQLNRVSITNISKGWQEQVFWPDTILKLQNGTGIDDTEMTYNTTSLQLSQNNPNPFSCTTYVNLTVADAGAVTLEIVDGNGRIVETTRALSLPTGIHQFRVTMSASGTYVLTARQKGQMSSIKMVCNEGGNNNSIEYTGMVNDNEYLLIPKSLVVHPFDSGDQMEYVGYATINGAEMESQHIATTLTSSQTIVLPFDNTQLYVTTSSVSDILPYSATCGGTVFSDGGDSVIERGICWTVTGEPDITGEHISSGSGTGAFTCTITGLTPHRLYYVRAYATNSAGTVYGSKVDFNTACSSITVTISGADTIDAGQSTTLTATAVGAIYYSWDTYTADATEPSITVSPTTTTTYTITVLDVNWCPSTASKVVHVITVPTVTTAGISSIGNTTAVAGGNITNDGGAPISARGVCWSTSHNPTLNDEHTTDSTGAGSFVSHITGLTQDVTYYVRAYATNRIGTVYGSEVSFRTIYTNPNDGLPCSGDSTVTDIEGNIYATIQLGRQCWMKENLRTTKYADSTDILPWACNSTAIGYWAYPNNNAANQTTYGLLYNHTAVMNGAGSSTANPSGVQGICPDGWHVPSDAEWTQLTNYVSQQSQYRCGGSSSSIAKALASTTGWESSSVTCDIGNNPSENNATGFNVLPSGECIGSPSAYNFGRQAVYWTSTISGTCAGPKYRWFSYNNPTVGTEDEGGWVGHSVRCVRN